MANKIPEHLLQDAKEIEDIANDLDPSNNRRQIPEHLFKHYFLPLLTGDVKDNRPFIIEWIAMAGSPTSEVEVLHKDGTKTIIPPLMDTRNITSSARVDTPTLSDKMSLASETFDTIPAKGMTEIIETLSGVLPKDTSDGYTDTWKEILERFGSINDNEIKEIIDNENTDEDIEELFDL